MLLLGQQLATQRGLRCSAAEVNIRRILHA
jgi:hypothetical protein